MSSPTIIEITNGIVESDVDPSKVVLKATVRHMQIEVTDILSDQVVPFEANIAITLRLKEKENKYGIQVNWRDLVKRIFPTLKEFTVRMVPVPTITKNEEEPQQQQSQQEVPPAESPALSRATQASSPRTMPATPAPKQQQQGSKTAVKQPALPASAAVIASSAHPSLSPASSAISSMSASSSSSSVASTSSSAFTSPAVDSCCSGPRSGSKGGSSSSSSRAASDAGDEDLYEELSTCIVDGHEYVKPMTVFHESLACKRCTSTEHTFEEHHLLETRAEKLCPYKDRCNYGNECKWAHSQRELKDAKQTLAEAPYCFNAGNMCYMWKKDRAHAENSGYLFFAGCGSSKHVLATSKTCW